MIKLILCVTFFINIAFANNFLVGFVYEKNLPLVKLRTTLFIFEDGSYVYNTSSGSLGLCQDTSEVGEYTGKISKNDLNKTRELLDLVEKECQSAKACKKGFDDDDYEKFVVLDYRRKGQNFTFSSSQAKLIKFIDAKTKALKQSPKKAIALKVKKGEISLNYAGKEKYKTYMGIDNFIVQKKSGAFVKLKNYKKEDSKSVIASFDKRKRTHSIKPRLDWKRLLEEGNFLIYTNKTEAHHTDKDMKILTPCTKL